MEGDHYYYIATEEFKGGELFSLLEEWMKNKNYGEKSVVKIISQVLKAIHYVHTKNIIHRDLKPENIMLENEENLKIKVIDFGCSI